MYNVSVCILQFIAFLITEIIAIDCEMVAVKGSGVKSTNALASFTAVSEKGEVVLSTYVKPDRPVLHYLTW
jgi:hypothetical protein